MASDAAGIFAKASQPIRLALALTSLTLIFAAGAMLTACDSPGSTGGAGSYPAATRIDCLPDVKLVDQHGKTISLSSLKGRPVLIDFIYTSCPGPCEALTSRMGAIARGLDPALRSRVQFVSVSIDPEHDRSEQLLRYARARGADQDGWLFLTGSPAQIDYLLALFNLRREREPDGSIGHVVEMFLLGPDGRQTRQYNPELLKARTVAADLKRVLGSG